MTSASIARIRLGVVGLGVMGRRMLADALQHPDFLVTRAFPVWPREFQATAAWVGGREQGGFVREVFSHFAYLTDRLVGPLRPEYVVLEHRGEGSETAAYGLLRAGEVPVPGAEADRLSLFARSIRGEQSPDLADFSTAYRVQQAVEAFHATPAGSGGAR